MQEEKYGNRDRSYSIWHRRKSTQRYIGIEKAQLLAMIDLDASLYVEYDDETKDPVALIEIAVDVGQPYKTATVTKKLAIRANIPALVVLYKLSENKNPTDDTCQDIESFKVKRLFPKFEKEWRKLTPKEYAENLLKIREWSANRIDKEPQ